VLQRITTIVLNVGLLGAATWAFAGDYCLLRSATRPSGAAAGILTLAFIIQLLSLAAIYTGINRERGYFRFVATFVSGLLLRGALFLIPFLFLVGSHDLVSYSAYSLSGGSKLQNAKSVAAGLQRCRSICWWSGACK
jgi:hypothetical protein